MIKDMTKENPDKILIIFTLPLILGNIFQQLYNIFDSIIVGNFLGANALAAVGASYPITYLFVSVASGLSIGASIVISNFFGGKNYEKMLKSIKTILLSLFLLSILLTIIGLSSSALILKLLRTPSEIIKEADSYLRIYFLGLCFLFIFNCISAIFNALGDSKVPLYFLILSSALNIILDLYFICVLNLGIAGAALATFISQLICTILSILCLIYKLKLVFKNNINNIFNLHDWLFIDFKLLKHINSIAFPSMIQQSVVSFGFLFVQSFVNSYGTNVISGYTAATKIDSIAIVPIVSISNAISTFTAQNYGAHLQSRIKKGYKSAIKISLGFSLIISLILNLSGSKIITIFLNSNINDEIINIGQKYIKVVSLGYFIKALSGASNGILKGVGDMKFFLISSLSNFVTRVIACYSLSIFLNEGSIWYSIILGWLIEFVISTYRCLSHTIKKM